MDTVIIDNVTYTKVAVLAKKFRYTTDYIGQLCRLGKIKAKLVGRAWYANYESLEKLAKKRLDNIRKDEIVLNKKDEFPRTNQRIRIRAPLSKQTRKMLPNLLDSQKNIQPNSVVRYEADVVDLLPSIWMQQIKPILPTVIAPDLSTKVGADIESAVVNIPIKIYNNHTNKPYSAYSSPTPRKVTIPVKKVPNSALGDRSHQPRRTTIADPNHFQLSRNTKKPSPMSFSPISVAKSNATSRSGDLIAFILFGLSILIWLLPFALDLEVQYEGITHTSNFSLKPPTLTFPK